MSLTLAAGIFDPLDGPVTLRRWALGCRLSCARFRQALGDAGTHAAPGVGGDGDLPIQRELSGTIEVAPES